MAGTKAERTVNEVVNAALDAVPWPNPRCERRRADHIHNWASQ
jgi:hypothetical protein